MMLKKTGCKIYTKNGHFFSNEILLIIEKKDKYYVTDKKKGKYKVKKKSYNDIRRLRALSSCFVLILSDEINQTWINIQQIYNTQYAKEKAVINSQLERLSELIVNFEKFEKKFEKKFENMFSKPIANNVGLKIVINHTGEDDINHTNEDSKEEDEYFYKRK